MFFWLSGCVGAKNNELRPLCFWQNAFNDSNVKSVSVVSIYVIGMGTYNGKTDIDAEHGGADVSDYEDITYNKAPTVYASVTTFFRNKSEPEATVGGFSASLNLDEFPLPERTQEVLSYILKNVKVKK